MRCQPSIRTTTAPRAAVTTGTQGWAAKTCTKKDLHEGGERTGADHEQAENLRVPFVGGGVLAIPAPLALEVLLEILLGSGLPGPRPWIAFACLIRHGVLAHRGWPVVLCSRT